ncbi:MAG: sensory box sensor histidine kinase [Myxococcales bacterium]|nr:sensory box sensor histidine kinase [Myxococcales bacterium]
MAHMPKLTARFRAASRVCGAVVSLVGALVFAAWALDNPTLNRALAGHFIMQLNTGLAFILAGTALWSGRRVPSVLCAIAVTGVGVFMLVEHLRTGSVVTGRMEPDTASGFVLIGTALILRDIGTRPAARVAEWLTIVCLLLAMVGLFGFTYNVKFWYGITQYVRMTLGTALSFVALGLGTLFAEPERGVMATVVSDSAGGVMARRLYPAAIAIPILLGQLTLIGEGLRLYNGKFGLSLFLLTSIVVFVLLVSLTYRALDRTDGERMRLAAVLLEEAERRHIAKELHDEVGQSLTALKLRLQVAEGSEQVLQARGLVDELLQRVSKLSLDLRPAMLDDLGLLPALVWLFDRYTSQTSVQVQFAHSGIEGRRVSPIVETAAFRIVQEALTNVARHAEVKAVDVRVWRDGDRMTVQVADAGKGFDAPRALAAGQSTGLSGMRERAGALGGKMEIDSTDGGTRLTAELPLPAEPPAAKLAST